MEQTKCECPLCHHGAKPIGSFKGAYDHDVFHIVFERDFYRCDEAKCGAVYFYDELTHQADDPNWEVQLHRQTEEVSAHQQELLGSDVYRSMARAREENDVAITKDRDLLKQVREITDEIQKSQEKLDDFMNQMRNFVWDDEEAIQNWVMSNWLPPSFAEKSIEATFAISRPMIRKDMPDETRAEMMRDNNPSFTQGQTVRHNSWGQGRIVEGNDGGGTIITAEFPSKGLKKIDLRFAKLERIS